MKFKGNPRQLVLRRDTATGITQVGWETDLPIGRFEHLQLICEPRDDRLPEQGSEDYPLFQQAIQQARQANAEFIQQQIQQQYAKGWRLIPFELSANPSPLSADEFGNYSAAAMQLQFELSQNKREAWAVIVSHNIVHVRSRQPPRSMDELSYQVWYHQQLHQLNAYEGEVIEGQLRVCESGLWLCR